MYECMEGSKILKIDFRGVGSWELNTLFFIGAWNIYRDLDMPGLNVGK